MEVEVFDFRRSLDSVPPEIDFEASVSPGEPGYPCSSSVDCLSGFCVATPDGKKCSIECLDECPFGWSCTLHKPSLPDETYICAPALMNLCRPCLANADCSTNGVDLGDTCLSHGDAGNFCGGNCEVHACPPGYECKEADDIHGGHSAQCLLTGEECACPDWFIDEGAATTCHVENEWGSCPGHRECAAAGLTPCDAPVPAEEECNGEDDDCDGSVDEGGGWGDCVIENAFGECLGKYACQGGDLYCQGEEPSPEACDGLDSDCDGETDEGFSDSDNDGFADCVDKDDDNDEILDALDNCPVDANPLQEDMDDDEQGDVCDAEKDGDGIANLYDNCPGVFNPPQGNIDGDAVGDACDDDMDGDGFVNEQDNCPSLANPQQLDFNDDGEGDVCDADDDGDGDPDATDCLPTNELVHHGAPELCNGQDDNCNFGVDEGFPDSDFDGLKDCVDDDDDNDGDVDVTDCQPLNPQVHQAASEKCNATDDNCDDQIDEGFGMLECGLGECFQQVPACDGGQLQSCNPFEGSSVEICDGKDNNCNGVPDDGFQVGQPCVVGLGMCAAEGVLLCSDDGSSTQCSATPGVPDCDGKECGDDGCSGLCGQCPGLNFVCVAGICECQPDCLLKNCGDDGCEGSCGACGPLETCNEGVCNGCEDGNYQPWDGCTNGQITEFLVNTVVSGNQQVPDVAVLLDGGFVVVWESAEQDGDGYGVFGQRFDTDGTPAGPEFQVNVDSEFGQTAPEVATLDDGRFVAVWEGEENLGDDKSSAFGRLFEADGTPFGDAFRLNEEVKGWQIRPSVAPLSGGGFVVTWQSGGAFMPGPVGDGLSDGIFGRLYSSSAEPAGEIFLANTTTYHAQDRPSVSRLGSGFVVAWESYNQDGFGWGAYAQRFVENAEKAGPEFRANTFVMGDQFRGRPCGLPGGRFVVSWEGTGATGAQGDAFASLYESDGQVVQQDFLINSVTDQLQRRASLAPWPDGGFLAAWESWGQDNALGASIYARRFNDAGNKTGLEFKVNSHVGKNERPSLAAYPDGSLIVVWDSSDTDSSGRGVYAQRFNNELKKMFR